MASCLDIRCTHCDNTFASWSDGNPYYLDPERMLTRPRSRCKVYVYHPHHPEHPIVGNDVPHLCLSCNHEFMVDTEKPRSTCTKCRSTNIAETDECDGQVCPKCREGRLKAEDSGIIS
jgi:hypothetical protein